MKTQPPEALPALIERLRLLPIDHAPDGWPAVRTREITALLDRITELEAQLAAIGAGGVEPLRSRLHQISEPAQSGRTADELGESQRQAAIAAYRAAHGHGPDFGFAPDRAWIEGAAYVDADRAMRAAQPEGAQQPGTAYAVLPEIDRVIGRLASSDPDFPDCEDAVVLLRKYRKLCQEIGRGDSHHLDRIEKAAIAVESRAPHGQAPAQAEPAISAGDAVFAFASMLTALPHVIPFGAAAWATPGVELATAFNAANGFSVSQNFPDGLVFPKITGDLLAVVETAAAPVAQGDALPREDFAWLVVQEACETEPADEDDPECIRILRRDLKSAVLAAFLRHDAARAQAKEGAIHE